MASGAFMGLSFAYMWLISMYQMWWAKTPPQVIKRASEDVG
jgi:hypothetical protein